MSVLYLFYEDLESNDAKLPDGLSGAGFFRSSEDTSFRVFPEKIRVPAVDNAVVRKRLLNQIAKSLEQYGATMLEGRSGMGKTALAAAFTKSYEDVAWYSIDSADSEWNVFFKYFEASFANWKMTDEQFSCGDSFEDAKFGQYGIAHQIEALLSQFGLTDSNKTRLIVLDNVHNVFDADWFADFFQALIQSILPNMHVLVLSRCQPPTPLWRLRSKQSLGVIDERLLAFNETEIHDFCKLFGVSPDAGKIALDTSFGRISKIREILNSTSE